MTSTVSEYHRMFQIVRRLSPASSSRGSTASGDDAHWWEVMGISRDVGSGGSTTTRKMTSDESLMQMAYNHY